MNEREIIDRLEAHKEQLDALNQRLKSLEDSFDSFAFLNGDVRNQLVRIDDLMIKHDESIRRMKMITIGLSVMLFLCFIALII